jgi:hypothetical protein
LDAGRRKKNSLLLVLCAGFPAPHERLPIFAPSLHVFILRRIVGDATRRGTSDVIVVQWRKYDRIRKLLLFNAVTWHGFVHFWLF